MTRFEFSDGTFINPALVGIGAFLIYAGYHIAAPTEFRWLITPWVMLWGIIITPHISRWIVRGLFSDVVQVARRVDAEPDAPRTQQEAISDSEIETRAKESAVWKGRVLAFLTKVIAYNAELPDHQQDRYRIWMWHVLPGEKDGTNMGAQGWTDIVASLNDAGQIAEIGDSGTFTEMPVLALFNAIWADDVTPLPRDKGRDGE